MCIRDRPSQKPKELLDLVLREGDNAGSVYCSTTKQMCIRDRLTPVISVVLFFVVFALLRMLVSMLVTVLGLVNRLPVIGTVNRWLGWKNPRSPSNCAR